MTRDRHCAIAVMAKAPQIGRVKTRLVPPLSVEEATALSGSFLADVTANLAVAAGLAPIRPFVAFAPAGSEGLFAGTVAPGTGFVLADGSLPVPTGVEGFGRCLLHAAQSLFAHGFGSVCLLNADSPTLPTALLLRAAALLAAPGDRAVLGPAEDGGYYLLGLKRPHLALFQDIAWSTERVAAQTTGRAADLGLETVTLPSWYDVDDAAALRRLLCDQRVPSATARDGLEPFAAPATTRRLAAIGLAERLDLAAAPSAASAAA